MKKLLISLVLLMAIPAFAQHWRHGHHGHRGHPVYYGHGGWVAPLIIGGVVGAAIANRPAQAQPDTIIVQQQPVYVPQESCTPWKEVQTPDGRIYRERTCTQ